MPISNWMKGSVVIEFVLRRNKNEQTKWHVHIPFPCHYLLTLLAFRLEFQGLHLPWKKSHWWFDLNHHNRKNINFIGSLNPPAFQTAQKMTFARDGCFSAVFSHKRRLQVKSGTIKHAASTWMFPVWFHTLQSEHRWLNPRNLWHVSSIDVFGSCVKKIPDTNVMGAWNDSFSPKNSQKARCLVHQIKL